MAEAYVVRMALLRKDWKDEIEPPSRDIARRRGRTQWAWKVQEWLTLHRFHTPGYTAGIGIDGKFGPCTEGAVKGFQEASKLEVSGVVDRATWDALVAPMVRAFAEVELPPDASFRDAVLYIARRFEKEHPTELRSNRGPWVRAFMRGHDGRAWAWCDGFVSTVLDHACNHVGRSMDEMLPWSMSCSRTRGLAESGDYACRWLDAEDVAAKPSLVSPGDLMLVIKPGGGAKHIGIVADVDGTLIKTIEGNTNDDGCREGYEVCYLHRDLDSCRYGVVHFLD